MDMSKEVVVEIERLTKEANEVHQIKIGDRIFVDKILNEIKAPKHYISNNKHFEDISSLITYLETIQDHPTLGDAKILIKPGYNEIEVYTEPDNEGDTTYIAEVKPLLPRISFGNYMELEEFIIQLQTKFDVTDNKKNLLTLISKFQTKQEVTTEDNGITQNVVVSKGQGLNEKIQLNPIVRLKAFRTFREVSQPDVMYLLRVNKHGELALFEADGGNWQFEAQQKVRDYLREQITEAGLDGKVVVL